MKIFPILALLASPAAAQGICADRDLVLQSLADKYEEQRHVYGFAPTTDGGGYVFELYANRETGSWTALAALPDGTACVIAIGTDYRVSPQGEAI